MTLAENATRTRTQSSFSWGKVDASVIKAMLRVYYHEHGRDEELTAIRSLSPEAAARNAELHLGPRPRPSVFTSAMCQELRHTWLPRASASDIDSLTATVRLTCSPAALKEPVGTKREQLAFLSSRPVTKNFRVNLRTAFLAAHRERRQVVIKGGEADPRREVVDLVGEGRRLSRPWYQHQKDAHQELDHLWASGTRFGARLVLPTGAGKTDTAVGWLLDRMGEDPSLRVLWLVHQQELVDQAVARFAALACHQRRGFRRRARAIHSAASTVMTLADPDLSVAAMTYQSFKSVDARKRRALAGFLAEPTVVVVDEAHHAGAPSYQRLLDLAADQPEVRAFLGLTATPYPTASEAQRRFDDRFPKVAAQVPVLDLVRTGILASPLVTTVDTGQVCELTASQVQQAGSSDIPLEVLGRLDNRNRDRVIVDTWQQDPRRWGKTLAFATRISHADALTDMFRRRGVDVRSLHSGTRDRHGTLAWFRAAKGPAVLVSVGMLTEGVDLPDARTAFLARPTTSPILMRQMVGRVLRGPHAGGEAEAHLVHFRDAWTNLPDVLYPEEVVPRYRPTGEPGEMIPGPILDDEELEIRDDLAAQVARAYERLAALFDADDNDPFNDQPPPCLLETARIVGFYDTEEFAVPVFGHQTTGFEQLLADAASGISLQGRPLLSYFEDTPPPYPPARALKTLVSVARDLGEVPPLQPMPAQLGPQRTARRILDAGALTDQQRGQLIEADYRSSINHRSYRSLGHYEEAVDAWLRDLRRPTPRFNPEDVLRAPAATKPPLPRFDRELAAATELAVTRGRQLLPPALGERLNRRPEVLWTRRVVTSTWGHWSLKLAGKGRGRAVIRVNRVLRTRPKHVSDEMLAYLVYHELLHHLLAGQGHDAEFRDLEARWPDAEHLDFLFDTLHEHWDLRPQRYTADVEQ